MTDRNLAEWREILAGAESDERGSRESLEDYERTLIKVRERHEQDVRSLERIRKHVELLEQLAGEPVDNLEDEIECIKQDADDAMEDAKDDYVEDYEAGGEEDDYRFAKDRDEWRHEAVKAQRLK